jgi:hypothetical protein
MEGHRFDRFVRTLAAPRSRRQLLRGCVATSAAALALRLSSGAVARQVVSGESIETCSQDSDCAPAEPDPCHGAFCDAGSCTYTSVACIRGHVCCGNGECCPEGEADTSAEVTSGDTSAPGESGEAQPEVMEISKRRCSRS